MTQILYFFIYSFLGWVCECIYCGIGARRFINRGFLEGPYCPIYGWGALIVLYALEPFKNNLVLLFFAGMILTSLLEYATSVVMEKMFHSTWWDYSNRRFNLNGRICLRNSVMFGVMGVVVVRIIHPVIDSFLIKIPSTVQIITTILLMVVFLWDNIHTFHAILRENKDYRMVEDSLRELGTQFRNAALFPLEEPLSQRIAAILEQTDADEKLMQSIERLREKYQKRLNSFRHTQKRLADAFPQRLKQARQENINAFFKALEEHRKAFQPNEDQEKKEGGSTDQPVAK